MCIAIAIDPGVALPSKEVLYRCFRTNPDGAGFAWSDGKVVHFSKGYMDPESAIAAMSKIPKEAGKLLHFRIATHGAVSQEFCHPFPVVDHQASMYMLEGEIEGTVMVHNGVMSKFGKDTKVNSDSSDFAMKFAAGKATFEDVPAGNKIAFLEADGQITLVGKWIEASPGLYYSNKDYVPYMKMGGVAATKSKNTFVGLRRFAEDSDATVLLPDTDVVTLGQLKDKYKGAQSFHWDNAENVYMGIAEYDRPILIGCVAYASSDIREEIDITSAARAEEEALEEDNMSSSGIRYDNDLKCYVSDDSDDKVWVSIKEELADELRKRESAETKEPAATNGGDKVARPQVTIAAEPKKGNKVAGQPPRPEKKSSAQTTNDWRSRNGSSSYSNQGGKYAGKYDDKWGDNWY